MSGHMLEVKNILVKVLCNIRAITLKGKIKQYLKYQNRCVAATAQTLNSFGTQKNKQQAMWYRNSVLGNRL